MVIGLHCARPPHGQRRSGRGSACSNHPISSGNAILCHQLLSSLVEKDFLGRRQVISISALQLARQIVAAGNNPAGLFAFPPLPPKRNWTASTSQIEKAAIQRIVSARNKRSCIGAQK